MVTTYELVTLAGTSAAVLGMVVKGMIIERGVVGGSGFKCVGEGYGR